MKTIILASASPRRKELLSQIGLYPQIIPSAIEEKITDTAPEKVVMSLAMQKAEDVARKVISQGRQEGAAVIGADTVVAINGTILGKPKDKNDAARMIKMLQGQTHQVYTGVSIFAWDNGMEKTASFFEETHVTVYPMDEREIDRYVSSGEPDDKAGAYGIQGLFAAHIKKIDGDYNNVVGLPTGRVYQELKSLEKGLQKENAND
ncbi:MAG: Maf family protein [Lachnospiraceae bacterium]